MGLKNRKFQCIRSLFVFFYILFNLESTWAISCKAFLKSSVKKQSQSLLGAPIREILPSLSWENILEGISPFSLGEEIIEKVIELNDRYELRISNYNALWGFNKEYDGFISIGVMEKLSGNIAIHIGIDKNHIVQEARVINAVLSSIAMEDLRSIPNFLSIRDNLGIAAEVDPNLVLKYQNSVSERVVPVRSLNIGFVEDSEVAIVVGQRQYAILRYREISPFRALKTFGADSCVIIALYQRATRTGVLMHVDDLAKKKFDNSINSIQRKLLDKFGLDFINHEWEISWAGGNGESSGLISKIRKSLSEFNFALVGQNIAVEEKNLWLDVENGSLSSFIVNPQLPSYQSLPLPSMLEETLILPARGSE